MARRDPFSFVMNPVEREKLALLARGASLSSGAWLLEKINAAWRDAFGPDAHPSQIAGLFEPDPRERIRVAGGRFVRRA